MSSIVPGPGWQKPNEPEPRIVYVQAPQKSGCFSSLVKVSGVIFLCLIGLSVLAGIFKSSSDKKTDPSTSASPSPTEAPVTLPDASESEHSEKRPTLKLAHIGETVKVGYWMYRVVDVSWMPFVGSGLMETERADAAFMVIDLAAANTDRTASMLPLHKLIDSQGREYETSSKGMFVPGVFSGLENLNPDIVKRGKLVFDVPPDRKYVLWLSGGLESGRAIIIDIPAYQAPQTAPKPQEQVPDVQPEHAQPEPPPQ